MRYDFARHDAYTLVAGLSSDRCQQPEHHAGDRWMPDASTASQMNPTHQEVDRETSKADRRHRAHDRDTNFTQGERAARRSDYGIRSSDVGYQIFLRSLPNRQDTCTMV
jgi:hypothetical protein